jgi:hypothetical protein
MGEIHFCLRNVIFPQNFMILDLNFKNKNKKSKGSSGPLKNIGIASLQFNFMHGLCNHLPELSCPQRGPRVRPTESRLSP